MFRHGISVMRMRHLPPAVALTAALAAPVLAQGIPADQIDAIRRDGACDEDQLSRIDLPGDYRRGVGYTFVLKSGRFLATGPRPGSERIEKPLQVLEEATIYGTDPGTGRILVALRQRTLCGWVDPADRALLLEPGAEMDRQTYRYGPRAITVGDSPYGQDDPRSTLSLKIVVQNTNLRGGESVPVYETPGGDRMLKAEQLAVAEVFRIETAVDPWTGRSGRFLLAGWTPAGVGLVRKRLWGWVREADTLPWRTRIAAMWEGSGDVPGYRDIDRLRAGAEPDYHRKRGFSIESEVGGMKILPRFPVIEQYPSDGQLREKLGRRFIAAEVDAAVEAFRVAVPAEACDSRGERCTPSGGMAAGGMAAYYFPVRSGGKPAFTFWVALERPAMERLQFMSQSVCRFIGQANSFVYIKNDILIAVDIDTDERTPAEAIEKRLFIPASRLSRLMNKDWDALEQEIEDASPEKLEAMEKEFCRKSMLITLAMQGFWVDPDDLLWNPDNPKGERYTVPAASRKPFVWLHDSGDSIPLYYIPVSYLP
jgi:hypothetical protein